MLKMIDKVYYQLALWILEHGILTKIDGCAENGAPDEGPPLRQYDWLITREAQEQEYPLIVEAIELLRELI